MCRPCKAEYARKWRKEVGSRAAYERGISEAAAHLARIGMAPAAEAVMDLMRAA